MNLSVIALLLILGVAPIFGQAPRDNGTSPCDLATPGASDWMIISEKQSSPDLIIAAEDLPRTMERIACAEFVYTDSGLDAVTESQWTLVLAVVIDPEGAVERFRIIRQPRMGTDLLEPTKKALKQWRYRPAIVEGEARPVCLTLALPKPLGSRASTVCGAAKGDPPNQAAADGHEPPLRSGPRR
jgi:Gram-negative bacterial TonB protein C-terminal